jgi:hypothetical protein
MVSGVGQLSTYTTNTGSGSAVTPRRSDSTAALNGQIRRDQIQLNDWVTCVSAKTPKGKAEIQSLSASISAAKEQITRVRADQDATRGSAIEPSGHSPTRAGAATSAVNRGVAGYAASTEADRRSVLLNTWA